MSPPSYLLEWDSAHPPHQSIDVDVVTGPALLAGPYMREMSRHHDARPRTFAGWETGSGGPVTATAIRNRRKFYDRWLGGATTEWLVRSSSRRKIAAVTGGHANILTPCDTTIGPRARERCGMGVRDRCLREKLLQALLRSCGRHSRLRESGDYYRVRAALVPRIHDARHTAATA